MPNALLGIHGAAQHDPALKSGLMVDDVARPPVAYDQLEVGQSLEHRPGQAHPLLGDHDDLVIEQLIDEALRPDGLAEDSDPHIGR